MDDSTKSGAATAIPYIAYLQNGCSWLAAAILLSTAGMKFMAAGQPDRLLTQNDPLLGVTNRGLFIGVGSIETVVALLLVLPLRFAWKLCALGWLVAAFSFYRLAIHYSGIGAPCPCLGTGFSWWPWLERHRAEAALAAFVVLWTTAIAGATTEILKAQEARRALLQSRSN